MATKTLGAAGRFGVRYGQSVKKRITEIENKQRQRQQCPYCKGRVKRASKGIWQCKKCGKRFAGPAYYLDQQSEKSLNEAKPKVLNNEEVSKSKIKEKK